MMSQQSRVHIFWHDPNIARPEYCSKMKTIFARILFSPMGSPVVPLDDGSFEEQVANELSQESFLYETNTVRLFASAHQHKCIHQLLAFSNERTAFIVPYTIAKALIPSMVQTYTQILQNSSDHRSRPVYVLQNTVHEIDPIWRNKYSDYMLCFPNEDSLMKSLINNIGFYFIALGQDQNARKTLSATRRAREYFTEVRTLMKQAFNDDCPWQCPFGMSKLNERIAQCEIDINHLMLVPAGKRIAERGLTLVHLHLPSSATELFKNFRAMLNHLFGPYLTEGRSLEDILPLSQTDNPPVIIQCLLDSSDELALKKFFSSSITSPLIYLLGKAPETPQAKQEFYKRYPRVCAISEDPQELAMKIGIDVAMRSRVTGEKITRTGDKQAGTRSFDQCIELLERMKEVSLRYACDTP